MSCGAFALAAGLAPAASAAPARGLTWVLFVASSGHVAATGWLCLLREVRAHARSHRWRFRRVPVVLMLAGAATAAALTPARLAWLLLPFFGWQFFHFQKQNVGLAQLAAGGSGAPRLTHGERRVLLVSAWAGIGGLAAHPALLQIAASPGLAALFPVTALAFAAAVALGLALWRRRPRSRRPPALTAAYLMALAFFAPVFLFRSPYAAVGGLTIAHGLQYLLLAGLAAGGSARGLARAVTLAAAANVVLLGAVGLEIASHLHGGVPYLRAVYGLYLGAQAAHFVLDAGLWRSRGPLSGRLPLLPRLPSASADPAEGPGVGASLTPN